MDYSLLLAVHNITEEMKSTQKLTLLPPLLPSPTTSKRTPSSSDIVTTTSLSIHEEIRTTISTDSGIAMTTVPNLPTYIQYIRVIEFIRAQQEPSLRASSVINAENSLSNNSHNDKIETSSIKTVRPDSPSISNRNEQHINDNQSVTYRNSKSPTNHNDISTPFHVD